MRQQAFEIGGQLAHWTRWGELGMFRKMTFNSRIRKVASKGRLPADAAFDFGECHLALGECGLEFGLDLAAFGRIGVAQFSAQFFDVLFDGHLRLLEVCER